MKKLTLLAALLMAVSISACGDDDDDNGGGGNAFVPPAGTVAVNFTVNDTANRLFGDGDLEWKGGMAYDTATRTIVADSAWDGPFAPLYDDGPWTAGGHEPEGSTAGDHRLGITVWVTPPATAAATYEYGLINAIYEENLGNGWIWPPGPNGSFVVNPGQTTAINAAGLTIPAGGDRDLKLTLDTNNLAAGTWLDTEVGIKSSAWGWGELMLQDNGQNGDAAANDGIYTVVLSQLIGTGKPLSLTPLLNPGTIVEWNWVFARPPPTTEDPTPGRQEYKVDGVASSVGVTAATKTAAATSFTDATITVSGNNTRITVP